MNTQVGEIRVAPGETFAINLAEYKGDNRIWGEEPEIFGNGVVELAGYKSSPADIPTWQTWTFQALDEGSCMVHFKTSGHNYEVREWTYTLSVAVMSPSVTTFPVEYTTVETSSNVSENLTDMTKFVFTETIQIAQDVHGDLEGKRVVEVKLEVDLMTGRIWEVSQSTFTGTVNGKSGSYNAHTFYWGWADPTADYKTTEKSWSKSVGTIISGTDELANLRGTLHFDGTATPVEPATDPLTYEIVGPTLGTFWFLE